MAELSDDSLSDDDALKRDEDNDGPFGGLVFHWASDIGGWGNKALGDDQPRQELGRGHSEALPEAKGRSRLALRVDLMTGHA